MPAQKYPRANVTSWYQGKYPGSKMNANTGVLHTTEGTSLPTYGGGATAPTFTLLPNVAARTVSVFQHFDVDVSARALVNAAGGVETNILNCVQVEMVGTCDPTAHTKWTAKKTPHAYWPEAEDWALMELARLMRWLSDEHGVKLVSSVMWKPYPASYGTGNGCRLTGAQWTDYYGWLGHQHVPENLHGDPGSFPIVRVLDLAKRKAWETPAPAPAKTLEQRVTALEAAVKKLEAGK